MKKFKGSSNYDFPIEELFSRNDMTTVDKTGNFPPRLGEIRNGGIRYALIRLDVLMGTARVPLPLTMNRHRRRPILAS